ILLPDPDDGGWVDTLVLFKYDVVKLFFCPGTGRFRFRMGDFVLRRVSRPLALSLMFLERRRPAGWLNAPCEALRFARQAMRSGLSQATDHLFRNYRRRVLPADPGDYATWAVRFDTISGDELQALQERAELLGPEAPLISVLVPAYQTPVRWLRR